MPDEKLAIGKISKPRFEFRTFGKDFENVAFLMSRLSVPVPEKFWERTSKEIYIISRFSDENNIKIRDGKIDIKTFIRELDGLEQWKSSMKGEFPITTSMLEKKVFPAFKVDMPKLDKCEFTLDKFMAIIKKHSNLQTVSVEKERFGFMVNNTICEYANVWINGAMVVTVNSESTELEDIKKTIQDLGLENFENINYLQAVKRVVGMIDKGLAN